MFHIKRQICCTLIPFQSAEYVYNKVLLLISYTGSSLDVYLVLKLKLFSKYFNIPVPPLSLKAPSKRKQNTNWEELSYNKKFKVVVNYW